MTHRLALIGFGTVGQALTEILQDKKEELLMGEGLDVQITAVADPIKGCLYHPEGLDTGELLRQVEERGNLDQYPDSPGLERGWDSFRTIRESNADTVIEVSYTDGKTGQPAIDHCKAAFESGKNVVMTNKGPVALAYRELSLLAECHGVRWGFEGTVMSGTPTLRLARSALRGNEITRIRGIFNGTTNFILARMEDGIPFGEALVEAQKQGIAEADPTSDMDGTDVLFKVLILSQVVLGVPLDRDQVECRGIRSLSGTEVQRARQGGKRWKLLGQLQREGKRVTASVQPVLLPLSDPLAGVTGTMNAVTYQCDLAGPVTLVGAGAGRKETGYALLSDLLHMVKGHP
ncbi:homoserine dehydrogenase [Desmospora profundinema]|uniref:Homoserine dehydrogenase n=1 Tax=Desmospora profundinema TaxID=1571184 RepID=A0ABU1IJC7_9BACL|nr:homoserine dehydrogenase [Desmospora profundinema]MDR6224099.1 homoserine dehydrogenase [Desmospora profundinema]